MIKLDLIQAVAARTGLSKAQAEAAVEAVFGRMKSALESGERIELRGFGVFSIRPRKTGVGRNPRTGAEVAITPGKSIRFRPGKEMSAID
ncbi:MAG: HU family DNA-binding protein [Terriglobales bacterium]